MNRPKLKQRLLRPGEKKKRSEVALSRRDKLKIVGAIVAAVAIIFGWAYFETKIKHAKNLEDDLRRFRTRYHLNDEQVRQTRRLEEQFREHDHGHTNDHGDMPKGAELQDVHEAAHALDIQKRFMNREVTTPQIVLFGLTGGLLPCPAAFTVLIVCMQVKQFTLGFALVAAFSFGLALTMVTVGAVAAWSVGHAEKKFSGFENVMRKAPYLSCALLLTLASYMAWQGWQGLAGHHH